VIVQTTLDHIQEHIRLLSDPANATLLQLLGQTPLVNPQPIEGVPNLVNGQSVPTNEMAESMLPNQPNMPKPLLPGQQIPPNPVK
jgi:hypothetical protein